MRAAAAWLLGSLATNTDIALAWQQWQPSNNNYSSNNKFDRCPSLRYLYNYDPNNFDYSLQSKDERDDSLHLFQSRDRRINKATHSKRTQPKSKQNLSFHNYPLHIAPPEKKRRKRSRLASRSSSGSAILPTKLRKHSEFNRLTFAEETEIAYNIQSYAAVMRIKDDIVSWMSKERSSRISGLNKVPSEEHWASACSLTVGELHDVIHRGQEAREKLVSGNVGLVMVIAKKYYNMIKGAGSSGSNSNALKLDDLIQEGYIGIMDAAERFDPTKGFRFSTYGSYWVRQRILRSISESSRIIRLPEHVQTMIRSIHKKRKEFEQVSGRTPSLPELAHELDIPLEKVALYQHLRHNVMSLEHQLNQHSTKDEKQITVEDRIACNEIPTPDEDAMSEAFRGEVHSMLDHLGDNERWVLTHKFGLEDGYPRTLREISEEMCVSIDIVKNIETKALNKLRQPGMMYRLKDYVDGGGSEESWDANGYSQNHHMLHNHGIVHSTMHHDLIHHHGMESGPATEDYEYIAHQRPIINVEHVNQRLYSKGVTIDDDLDEYERPTPESIWSF